MNEQEGRGALDWARLERKIAEYLKVHKSELKVNADKYILGQIALTITGDDYNCIQPSRSIVEHPDIYPPHFQEYYLERGRRKLLERLEWESSEGCVPQQMRERIERTKNFVQTQPWVDEASVNATIMAWTALKEYIHRQILNDKKLLNATKYYKKYNSYVVGGFNKSLDDTLIQSSN